MLDNKFWLNSASLIHSFGRYSSKYSEGDPIDIIGFVIMWVKTTQIHKTIIKLLVTHIECCKIVLNFKIKTWSSLSHIVLNKGCTLHGYSIVCRFLFNCLTSKGTCSLLMQILNSGCLLVLRCFHSENVTDPERISFPVLLTREW